MNKVRDVGGHELDFGAVVRHMDRTLLQELQASGEYSDSQAIFEAYAHAHAIAANVRSWKRIKAILRSER